MADARVACAFIVKATLETKESSTVVPGDFSSANHNSPPRSPLPHQTASTKPNQPSMISRVKIPMCSASYPLSSGNGVSELLEALSTPPRGSPTPSSLYVRTCKFLRSAFPYKSGCGFAFVEPWVNTQTPIVLWVPLASETNPSHC